MDDLKKENKELKKRVRELETELNSAQVQLRNCKLNGKAKDESCKIFSVEKERRDLYLDNLLKVMPEIVLFLDENLKVVMCSESYLKVSKMKSYDEIIGTPGISARLEYPEGKPSKHVEQELFDTMRKAKFLANMSHEIRTPMNAIKGMIAIARNTEDEKEKNTALKKINSAAIHLLGVINDILDMSKIEAQKLTLSIEEFDLKKMMHKITNVVGYSIEQKNQEFIIDSDESIPRYLTSDDQRLTQVITNLLSNAIKFTPNRGKITLQTKLLEVEDEACTIEFSVTDTGIGINKDQQKHLFQSFEQADSDTSRKFGGSGLGLVISKSIVEMLGGKIWVESEEGKGSKFTFYVKTGIGEGRYTDNIDDLEELNKGEEIYDFSDKTVLLVEDIEINREILITLLESTSITIDSAENGKLGVEMVEKNPDLYDAILMDVQMPEMDGYEATRKIRKMKDERARSIPIIAMTANVFKEDIDRCIEAGMNDHIGKPVDILELESKLTKTFNQGRT